MELHGQSSFEAFKVDVASLETTKVYRLSESVRRKSVLAGRHLVKAIKNAFVTLDPDAVCVPGWGSPLGIASLIAARSEGLPSIVLSESQAADNPRVWWKEAVKRRFLDACSAALVGGSPHLDYLVSLGMPEDRIFMGYDVVDNHHFAGGADRARASGVELRQALRLPEQYFLASGRFIHKKNFASLLQGFAFYRERAGREAWNLVLLGDGVLRKDLERLTQSLGIAEAVHMPGFKNYEELPVYYGLAGAFVHSSTTEQWGLVVNEAMAAGLPVIVSDRVGCAADLVKHGTNGYIFDPYKPETLARYMYTVTDGDADRISMGQASRLIIERWTPRFFAENLLHAAEVAVGNALPELGVLDRAMVRVLLEHEGFAANRPL